MMKFIRSFLFSFSVLLCLPAFAGSVNINTADSNTLASELAGIGDKKAAAIVEYRETNGPYKSVEDLLLVKGIGESILEKNRDKITIE